MRNFEVTPSRMIDQLRTWFFAKDRSIVLANGNRSYLMDGITQLGPSGAWTLISEVELTASAASVTFSNIPQIFRTLVLVVQARTDRAAEGDAAHIRFNGDSGNNYDRINVTFGNSTTTLAPSRAIPVLGSFLLHEAANSRASNFTPAVALMPGYAQSDKEKWAHGLCSARFGDISEDADLFIRISSGRWRDTDPISSITLLPAVGPNYVSGSIFQLYGIL